MTITKSEIVDEVVKTSGLKRFDANKFVDDFFEVVSQGLESGNDVKIPGFGNFILRDKKERIGRNPKTKKEHVIASRRVVSFRTSNILKATIKDSE